MCAEKKSTGGDDVKGISSQPDVVAHSTAAPSAAMDVEKRIKAVQKKLKQIAELKEKRNAGAVLDEGQVCLIMPFHTSSNLLSSHSQTCFNY